MATERMETKHGGTWSQFLTKESAQSKDDFFTGDGVSNVILFAGYFYIIYGRKSQR